MSILDKEVTYKKAREFIYRNARPLDIARWQYHFEDGTKESVLKALSVYQNEDGGFGHALEPDCWNPESSPIQTWCAIEILREIDFVDKEHLIVQGVLSYLASGKGFAGNKWQSAIRSNNDYPHAPWWHWRPDLVYDNNPTANFVGFILRFADKDSRLYHMAIGLLTKVYGELLESKDIQDGHLLLCFVRLYQYCNENGTVDFLTMKAFREKLFGLINVSLNNIDIDWTSDGVALEFIKFLGDEIGQTGSLSLNVNKVQEYIIEKQLPDGSWSIPWKWDNHLNEWAVSENWWKSYGVIVNLKFLAESIKRKKFQLQKRVIASLGLLFNESKIPYHFDGSTSLFIHGIDVDMDDIDICFPQGIEKKVRNLVLDYNPTQIIQNETYGFRHFKFYMNDEEIHCMFYSGSYDEFSSEESEAIMNGQRVVYKSIEFHLRHLDQSSEKAKKIRDFISRENR